MSSSPSPSPSPSPDYDHPEFGIHRLDTYTLQSIFDLNANINDERPLENARHTSQVCMIWRELMLTSPEIWGQILKLSELQTDEDDSPWRELVLERTGTAPLFLKGKIDPSRVEWFLDFLSPHWGRTHSLDVAPTDLSPVAADNGGFMERPSPCTVFNFPGIVFDFNLQSPWLSNLRVLTLAMSLNTSRVLECLGNTPNLERVKLTAWFPNSALPGHPPPPDSLQISLPHLTNLHLEHEYSEAADVLRRITPNIECAYTFFTREDKSIGLPQCEIFSRCFQRQINLRNESKLTVVVRDNLSITVLLGVMGNRVYIHNHNCEGVSVEAEDLRTYMARFYCGDSSFEKITEIDLNVEVGDESIKYIFDSIAEFLAAFPAVTTLKLSQQSLFLFTEIYVGPDEPQPANELLFPSLTKVVFGYNSETINFPVDTLLPKFLHQRRSFGRPIKQLSLGPDVEKLNLHWGFLEEFDDMKVTFSLVLRDGRNILATYLCGSKEPDDLNMTEGWEERHFSNV